MYFKDLRAFFENVLRLSAVNYFRKKLHIQSVYDRVLNTSLYLVLIHSPTVLYLKTPVFKIVVKFPGICAIKESILGVN